MKALEQGALSRDTQPEIAVCKDRYWAGAGQSMARTVSGRAKCGQKNLSSHFAWRICEGKDYKAPVQGDLSLISQTLAFL